MNMLSRVTAEFETSELAELALKRARESSKDIYSTEIMYNKRSERAAKLSDEAQNCSRLYRLFRKCRQQCYSTSQCNGRA